MRRDVRGSTIDGFKERKKELWTWGPFWYYVDRQMGFLERVRSMFWMDVMLKAIEGARSVVQS